MYILAKWHHQLPQTLLARWCWDPIGTEELFCMGYGSGLVQQLPGGYLEYLLLLSIEAGLFRRHQYGLLTIYRGIWVHDPDCWCRHL